MKRIRSEKEGDALDPGPPLNWFPCGPFLYNPPGGGVTVEQNPTIAGKIKSVLRRTEKPTFYTQPHRGHRERTGDVV